MANVRIPATTANLGIEAMVGTPANGGKLRIYDGTQPAAGGGAITTQVKLVEFTLNADAFGAPNGGIVTASTIGIALGLAASTATWFRIVKSDGTTVVMDGDAGGPGSGATCILDNAVIAIDDVIAVLSLTVAQPLL